VFAEENLFDPLGFRNHRWNEDGEGLSIGWSELYLTPEDMAKFGFLYLNDGQWDGQQIVSREWVRQSCSPLTPAASGIQPFYGYQWWVNPDLGFCNAAGAGGNYIIVVPEQDLVVVFTANITGAIGDDQGWEGTPEELFRVFILPAVVTE
jgi:CubicO group peptidase (beta-lactamase class C family)